jgi:hypothetical protein
VIFALVLLLAPIQIADCRVINASDDYYRGLISWRDEGNSLIASSTIGASGSVTLSCRVRLHRNAKNAFLRVKASRIDYTPATDALNGSGVVIRFGGCELSLLRTAGEDWIEYGAKECRTSVPPRRLEITLIDVSTNHAVHATLDRVIVEAGSRDEH